jgi:delta14-sterol reductase/lamin-B receptor
LKGKLLGEGGISKNSLYNFFMGRELNPRIGTFDWKYFCELRPGLIGWTIINISMACKQYHSLGEVSVPMYLVNFMQALYTWDALYHESAILSTMDITTEGFGFMLAMGDLGWVPFTYSLQALYLVNHDPGMQNWYYALVAALGALSYAAFRGSNGQKDRFRRLYKTKPELFENLESMPTKRGTRLITGGWWGICRKINYTADIGMALAWSLCTGGALLPYFYPAYLFGLLTHRAFRDDNFCQQKYGDDWDEYKKKVPYMIIPGIL